MADKIICPEVSVILTVYNRAGYLRRCIDSLLAQSFTNWELISIDDGSTDNSYEILKGYETKYKNIKVARHKNIKLPLSRNRGMNLSSGKYITFLDSDDEFGKDHLMLRVNYMNKHPEIDLLHGGVNIIGNEFVRDKNNPEKFIHLSLCTIGATFFGRREVFAELKGFKNIKYSEDSEFIERATMTFNVKKVNFNTYIYHRDAADSITNTYIP